MNPPLLETIPYRSDSTELLASISGRAWPVLLDSGQPAAMQGRYDLVAADPYATLVTEGASSRIERAGQVSQSTADPFSLLRELLAPWQPAPAGLPFAGGAIGYFGYDLARRLERLPSRAAPGDGMPDLAVGLYDWVVVVDHWLQRSWLVGQGRSPNTRRKWRELVELLSGDRHAGGHPAAPFRTIGRVEAEIDRSTYDQAFMRIHRYIRDGDCYQVNYAQRFRVACEGSPLTAYRLLRQRNPAPFGAFLQNPYGCILSSSPERFLQLRGRRVETRPIKGTRPRLADPQADARQIEALRRSDKDRAENLMIVDLLRNDLGRCCRAGSIGVAGLFEVESFATVHHLVSTVYGELADGEDALSLLRAAFPGGSITGAPKVRAMEIIEELEPRRRGVYCGAIGYLGFDGNMDSNIAIRTLVQRDGEIQFAAGGGIVADSRPDAEYQESLDKARAMLDLFDATGRAE